MASNVTYIVDDQDESIEYLCPVTKQTILQSFFNATWTTIASTSCGGGWFRHKFNGTGVRISASSSRVTSNFSVQVDDSPLLVQSGQGIYESPILADGEHTVLYAVSDASIFPTFDYLTVTAGASTSLNGRAIIVDDDDVAIRYSGNWSQKPPSPIIFDFSTSPYLNTTHWSDTVGDSISFQFSGSSISVYGVVLNTTTTTGGNVTTAYTVDGKTTVHPLPEDINQSSPMAKLFHADLDAGDHTLLMNVTSVTAHHALGFDFVTYTGCSETTHPTSSSAPLTSAVNSPQVGAIVGGVLGGVVGLIAIALLFIMWTRRRQKARNSSPAAMIGDWTTVSWADSKKVLDPNVPADNLDEHHDRKAKPLAD